MVVEEGVRGREDVARQVVPSRLTDEAGTMMSPASSGSELPFHGLLRRCEKAVPQTQAPSISAGVPGGRFEMEL